MKHSERLLLGLMIPYHGLQTLFKSRQILLYAVIPFLLGLIFLGLGIGFSGQYFKPWFDEFLQASWLQGDSFWQVMIQWLFQLFFWILVVFVNFFMSYLVIILVGGPFYTLLAEKVILSYEPTFKTQLGWKDSLRMVGIALLKILVFLVLGLICFVISWLPVLNILAALVIFLTVIYDCFDYTFEVAGLGLRQRWQTIQSFFPEMLGAVGALFLLSLVPGLFFLLLPAFIAGAAKLYIQKQIGRV